MLSIRCKQMQISSKYRCIVNQPHLTIPRGWSLPYSLSLTLGAYRDDISLSYTEMDVGQPLLRNKRMRKRENIIATLLTPTLWCLVQLIKNLCHEMGCWLCPNTWIPILKRAFLLPSSLLTSPSAYSPWILGLHILSSWKEHAAKGTWERCPTSKLSPGRPPLFSMCLFR